VHFQDLTDVEQRVLGCLIEKRWTTPDQYPLSINALRLACNQSTNRDPVTRYTEDQVSQAGQRLSKYGLARLASGHMLLRGPQTPGELKQRSERLVQSELTLADVERVLSELTERGYATDLGRRPGQKEDRWAQLLGGDVSSPAEGSSGVGLTASRDFAPPPSEERISAPEVYRPAPPAAATAAQVSALDARVAALETDLASLREQLADLLS
jgi:uncharacterized protein YceH (UPF0502 family)